MRLVVVDQLLHDAHVGQDADGGGADGVAAVLVAREGLLVQEGDAGAGFGEVVARGGARGARADDDGIVAVRREGADLVRALGRGAGGRGREGASGDCEVLSGGGKKKGQCWG